MFLRRNKKIGWNKIKHFIYPDGGYKRFAWYWFHRLGRLDVSPDNIAAGTACGVAISFTPFLGFHLIGGWLMCLVTRGNVLAMAIGQMFGNPWTLPIIWIIIYKLGNFLMGAEDTHGHAARLTLALVKESPGEVFWPLTIGGIVMAAISWPITFFIIRPLVRKYQEKRKARIANGKLRKFNIIEKFKHHHKD